MKTSIDMGVYYNMAPYGLVRTVCRATNVNSGESMIVYVHVGKGGMASEPFTMLENEFKNSFLS